MTPAALDISLPLADFLKTGTWPLHQAAEKTGVVSDILRQQVSMRDYVNYVQNLIEIYKTLESETAWIKNHASLADFFTSALYRQSQLEHDYSQLLSLNGSTPITVIHDDTRRYCEHIRHSQRHAASAMLAHIYVRYLGDLNGGQVLHRLLQSSLGLKDDCLTFYAFPKIQDIQTFRTDFRMALNSIVLSPAESDIAHQAALDAFQFNINLSMKCQSKSPL